MVKNLPANAKRQKKHEFDPWVRKIPWSRTWQPSPVFSPGESHGQRSLEGYSPRSHKESDMIEQLSMYIDMEMDSDELVLYLEIVDDILLCGDASKVF